MSDNAHSFSFTDIDLAGAESVLTGRCLTDKRLLQLSLETLPADCMRSCTGEIRVVFFALAGRLARGGYDSEANQEWFAAALAAADPDKASVESWDAFLDDLWVPWMAVEEYACRLLEAIVTAYRLQDAEIAAARANNYESPFAVTESAVDAIFVRFREAATRDRARKFINEADIEADIDWYSVKDRAGR